jgi:anti-repressor protein
MGFTGQKALEWKIKYIDAFSKMEDYVKQSLQQSSYLIEDPIQRAKAWIREQEEKNLLLNQVEELSPLAELARKRLDKTGTVSITDVTKTYGLKRGQITTWAKAKGYIHKTIQDVNKAGEDFFKVVMHGEYAGVAILEKGIRDIDKNINEIKAMPVSFKKITESTK